jgi:peptidoglycan/LPS O-acetylase OafA/YrhL
MSVKKRNLNLDILRTIAVLLVMGSHINDCPIDVNGVFNKITEVFIRGGWVGVDLFFVLSGFLVSGLIFREFQRTEKFSAKTFLIRRGLKIYPAFYAFLFTTFVVNLILYGTVYGKTAGGFGNWINVLAELTFFQNYLGGLWSHTWSLAVEEHFYVGLAILFSFVIRKTSRKNIENNANIFSFVPNLFFSIAIICLLTRFATSLIITDHPTRLHILATHVRIDSLMFGVLISYLFHYKTDTFNQITRKYRFLLTIVGALLLSIAFLSRLEASMPMAVVGLTLLYLGAGALLVGFMAFDLQGSVVVRFFGFLGSHSYSVYLWHMPINVWGYFVLSYIFGGQVNWYIYAITYLVGSWLIGIVMARIIEMPVLQFRDKVFPSN